MESPTVQMSRFEHVDGCKVCENLYKHYTYPNGKTVHFFHRESLHELVVETSVQLPDPPIRLSDAFQESYPQPTTLGLPIAKPVPEGDLPPISPAAPPIPQTPTEHTLDVSSHECTGHNCGRMGVLPDDDRMNVRLSSFVLVLVSLR